MFQDLPQALSHSHYRCSWHCYYCLGVHREADHCPVIAGARRPMRSRHEQVAVASRSKRKKGRMVLGREEDMRARWRKERGRGRLAQGEVGAGARRGWRGSPSRQCWCDRGGGRCVRVCELRQCRSAALARSLAPVRSLHVSLEGALCSGDDVAQVSLACAALGPWCGPLG